MILALNLMSAIESSYKRFNQSKQEKGRLRCARSSSCKRTYAYAGEWMGVSKLNWSPILDTEDFGRYRLLQCIVRLLTLWGGGGTETLTAKS